MRKYFLPVMAIASSVIISCQQSPPSTIQVLKTTNAAATKYVYPPEAISNYVDVCTKAGETKESCNCFITKAQDAYPLEKLVQLNNENARGKVLPKEIDTIYKSCQEKVAVVPEIKTSSLSQELKNEKNAERFLKIYLDTIIRGERGDVFFCDRKSVSTFFSPTDYKILSVKVYDNVDSPDVRLLAPIGNANIRIDSSNQGGSKITKNWKILLAKGTPQYATGEAEKYNICLNLITSID